MKRSIALWRLHESDAATPPNGLDRWIPQRPLFQISVFELILLTTGVIALLVSFQKHSAPALFLTATFVTSIAATKFAIALSRRRIPSAILLALIAGTAVGLAVAYSFGYWFRAWPWQNETGQLIRRARPDILRQLPWVVVPRSLAVSLLSCSLYLAIQALNAKLRTANASTSDGR